MDTRRLTDAYHQTVLGLTEESVTEVAWDVSQHTLGQLWDNNCTAAADKVVRNNPNTMRAATYVSNESAAEGNVYCCKGCGFRLHPGWRGSNIRVQRRTARHSASTKRTIRRREQRKQRKAARSAERKATEYNNERRTLVPTSRIVPAANDRLIVLCDDSRVCRLDRNILVITCGRCGDKTYIKGLRRDSNGLEENNVQSTPRSLASLQAKIKAHQDRDVASFGQDFEPVPKYKHTLVPKVAGVATSKIPSFKTKRSEPPISLLQQKMERKKKRKPSGPNRKPGNIHSFLSSLNDN